MTLKPTQILTLIQLNFLNKLSDSTLCKNFTLSGGTALTGFYLPYRYSEDLDFFSKQEVDPTTIITFLKSNKKQLGYLTFDSNTSFNRQLFFLKYKNTILKTEFTYYPFPNIDDLNNYKKIAIDSTLDIAVNKLFTIYQKPRSRDFIDLYIICNRKGYSVSQLAKKARKKFDWQIDPIKLGTQFLLSTELTDYPHLIEKIKDTQWQEFFRNEEKKLKPQILK